MQVIYLAVCKRMVALQAPALEAAETVGLREKTLSECVRLPRHVFPIFIWWWESRAWH
jgi:hypothetical protein